MEFTFLGTSSGVPTRQRNVSALALRAESGKPRSWCLVDCGEGTQHRLLGSGFSLRHLAAVLITHMHGDHCFGLPGLLASAGMGGRQEALTIVGPAPVREFVNTALRLSDSYLPFPVHFEDVEALDRWQGAGVSVRAWPLSHRLPSWAYDFQETRVERKLNEQALKAAGLPPSPLWGRLLREERIILDDGRALESEAFLLPQRKARRIIVGGDNDRPDLLAEPCAQADVLIHEATYSREDFERIGGDRQHSFAEQVGEFAQKVALKNLVLTHFSPRYQHSKTRHTNSRSRNQVTTVDDLAREAAGSYSGRLFLAEDLVSYRLDKEGLLHRTDEARG